MNKDNLKNNNDKFAEGNCIVSRFLNVIARHDWCRGRKFRTCCNVFKYPSPEANASTSPARGEVLKQVLLPQCAPDATGFLSDVYKRGTRARKFLADGVQCGRSMIEMLGVLAIIAVLSVGGIAGYSQALEKWKINKTLEGYSYLTQGLMEHIDNLRVLQPTNDAGKHYLLETIKGLNLIPEGWSIQNGNLVDTTGSMVTVFARRNHLVYDIALGTYSFDDSNNIRSDNFSAKLCREFISNFAQPLHSSLQYIWIFKTQTEVEYYLGDSLCSNSNKCLINMTLSDIQNACTSCVIGTDYCLLVLEF